MKLTLHCLLVALKITIIFGSLGSNVRITAANMMSSKNSDEVFFSNIEADNEEAFNTLQHLMHSKDGWSYVAEKQGVRVDRRFVPAGPYVDKEDAARGSKHACVMSSGVIDAPPEAVFSLFADNARVKEYNEHCEVVEDVKHMARLHLDKWTKIAWAASPSYGPFKPRDFVSVVHYRKYNNGTSIILNRPAYLSDYAPSGKYVRATVLLGANIIRPFGDGQTHLTLLAQVNPGGGADSPAAAWIINKLCAKGPPTFIRKLEIAAQKKIGGKFSLPNLKLPSLVPSACTEAQGSTVQMVNSIGSKCQRISNEIQSAVGHAWSAGIGAVSSLLAKELRDSGSLFTTVNARFGAAFDSSKSSIETLLRSETQIDPSIRIMRLNDFQKPFQRLLNFKRTDQCVNGDACRMSYPASTCMNPSQRGQSM